jgi:hypothetical protein
MTFPVPVSLRKKVTVPTFPVPEHWFGTGEVSQTSQKDIEPLREICYCLGISSLSPPYNNPSVYETVPSSCFAQCCGTVTIFYGSGSDF